MFGNCVALFRRSVVSGVFTDIFRNQDSAGRQIYNSQDTGDIRDAFAMFSREFTSKGTRSAEEIADAYERANDAQYRLTADFRDDVLAAIGLGKISPKKAEEILKANCIGKEDIAMIRSGRYKKYEASDAAKTIAPKDRINAAEAAVKQAKDTPL